MPVLQIFQQCTLNQTLTLKHCEVVFTALINTARQSTSTWDTNLLQPPLLRTPVQSFLEDERSVISVVLCMPATL